jgi:3-(3-hydroxy-phenyl)propionate hydroxylase
VRNWATGASNVRRHFKPYPFTAVHHAPALPSLRSGVDADRRRVVVVGGGPVGWCVALGLSNQGVPVLLLEADDTVCIGSRAICISRRSLEIIDRLGALPGFLAQGLPWTGGRSFYRDTEVLRFLMPQDQNQRLPPMINIAQYAIEQLLVERALQRPDLIEVRWQTRVTRVAPQADGVRVDVSTPLDDYAIESDWLVAADGGRSVVRDALGLKLEGTSYEGRYVIVDILMRGTRPTERLAYFDPPCNPGSTVLVHKQPNDVWRIDYQLRDGEDPDDAIRIENVEPRVESLLAMMGESAEWAPIWVGIYKANALTLPRYDHGRVLFAGDAAHLMPIFGVRGANSGIDDADNLAWKLAFVVKGAATPALLETYSNERVAAAHENLRQGRKSTEFMAPPSFAFDLMRTAVLGLAVRHPGVRSLINPRQTSAISYAASPLNAADDAGFAAGPAPGTVLPECPLMRVHAGSSRPGHVTELLGIGFTALLFTDQAHVPADLRALEESFGRRGVPVRVVLIACAAPRQPGFAGAWDHTGRLFPMYGADPGTHYLVRPDGHVLARWRQPSASSLARAIEGVLQFSRNDA